MKARLIVGLAGTPMREIGEVAVGEEAIRLIEAGLAVTIVEVKTETAVVPTAKRETRKKS